MYVSSRREKQARKTHNLRHVQDNNGRLETDTDTSNQTTGDNGSQSIALASNHLNDNTDAVDDTTADDGPLSANAIGKVTSDQGAKEGAARQDRSDERRVRVGQVVAASALDLMDEVEGAVDAVDVSGIVAEEDAAKRSKGAHQVGLPGDGSLDFGDILRRLEVGDGGLLVLVSLLGLVLEGGAHGSESGYAMYEDGMLLWIGGWPVGEGLMVMMTWERCAAKWEEEAEEEEDVVVCGGEASWEGRREDLCK